VGNLLKGSVKTVCVDINESTPMKLSNRGSKQAIGVVTDVSFFLSILAGELKKHQQEAVGQSPASRFTDHASRDASIEVREAQGRVE
jgi:hypothetical protein